MLAIPAKTHHEADGTLHPDTMDSAALMMKLALVAVQESSHDVPSGDLSPDLCKHIVKQMGAVS